MEKISWREKVTNEEVLRRIGEKRTLISTIYSRQKWIGHDLRHQSLLRDVIEGKLNRKRVRGRKRMMLFDHWQKKENNRTETWRDQT